MLLDLREIIRRGLRDLHDGPGQVAGSPSDGRDATAAEVLHVVSQVAERHGWPREAIGALVDGALDRLGAEWPYVPEPVPGLSPPLGQAVPTQPTPVLTPPEEDYGLLTSGMRAIGQVDVPAELGGVLDDGICLACGGTGRHKRGLL